MSFDLNLAAKWYLCFSCYSAVAAAQFGQKTRHGVGGEYQGIYVRKTV
jgi:hypothetical protein